MYTHVIVVTLMYVYYMYLYACTVVTIISLFAPIRQYVFHAYTMAGGKLQPYLYCNRTSLLNG